MRLIGYLRVSTIEQAQHGYGLDVQEQQVRSWCRRNGHRLAALYRDEGKSGALPAEDRPGLTDALLALRTGTAAGLICRDLDRLAREVTVQEAVLAEVWRLDRAVFTSTTGEVLRDDPDDPYRTAMRQMMGVFSGLERRLIVKRLRDGRRAKALHGYAGGAPPYGWTGKGGRLVMVPEEQAALRLMQSLAADGRSTREIAATLRADPAKYPTKRGGAWSPPVVARILARQPARREVA